LRRFQEGNRVMTQIKPWGFYLNGKWRTDGEPREVRAPSDQKVLATVAQAGPEHVEAAIVAACSAFEMTRKMSAFERQRVLRSVAAGLTERQEEFARTLAQEAGKPVKAARTEVSRAIFTFTIAAEESVRIYGECLPLDLQPSTAGRWAIVRRFPIGPIAAITPFNFPLNLVAHKWAPAIAAGNPVIHKPAPQTPLSSLMLAELVAQTEWPAGGLNVLPLSVEDAEPLVTDDRLKMLTFTGSAAVGWELKKKAGKKRVTLELGGNAGVIIHRDADLEKAAERCAVGGFSYAGQTCISVQRILVEHSVLGKFLDAFLPRVKKLKLGDPLDETTDVGPMLSEASAARALAWVEEAVAGGARLLCGGKRQGALLEPTVLTGTLPQQRVNCEEVFAPVVTVEGYDEFAHAIGQLNDSRYGLQAGIFTSDARLLFRAYADLEVGGVIAGDVPSFRIDHMPYGGTKDSGLGREGLRYAIEEMTERKLLVMDMG
jgi:acyl-CoA reductase-like NAD-dependent aldehyde dehydrogenase